jgi:1-phosphatidylinositol-4-phosphate 5-kinase
MEGKGISKSSEGMYDGEWKNSEMEGKGTFTWTDKSYYVGEWKEGRRDGAG